MKTKTIIPMTTKNIFGQALKELLDAAKNMLSRKEWTVLLGVSDAAISQWLSGKTFPAPEKIKTLISVYRSQKLDDVKQKKLDKFLSVIEMPVDLLWAKVPARVVGLKTSDYILDEFEQDLRNTMSHLYYDLKYELQKQLIQETMIHKDNLTKKILGQSSMEEVGVYERVRKNKLLAEALSNEVNRELLDNYYEKIKSYHTFSNELLKYIMEQDDFSQRTLKLDLGGLLKECKKKIDQDTIKTFTQGSYSMKNGVGELFRRHEKYSLPIDYIVSTGDSPDVNNVLLNESFSLFFKSPFSPGKNLMHVEINKVPEQSIPIPSNERSIYCTFDYFTESINNPKVFTDSRVMKTSTSEAKPDYAMRFNLENVHGSVEKWYESFPEDLSKILNSNRRITHKDYVTPYLITPELTDSNYLVEILKIGKNKKIPIETKLINKMVFLILGNVAVSVKNAHKMGDKKKHFLSSLFDRSKEEKAYIWNPTQPSADLNESSKYEIESQGRESIALIIHYKDIAPLCFTEKSSDTVEFTKAT